MQMSQAGAIPDKERPAVALGIASRPNADSMLPDRTGRVVHRRIAANRTVRITAAALTITLRSGVFCVHIYTVVTIHTGKSV